MKQSTANLGLIYNKKMHCSIEITKQAGDVLMRSKIKERAGKPYSHAQWTN